MNILIVSPVFWPEAFRINDLAAHLAAKGHRVEVLAGHPHYPEGRYFKGYGWFGPWREPWKGVHILRFPQVPRGRGQAWRLALQYLSFVAGGCLRLLVHGRWHWDVVFVFQTSPVTAALPALLARKLSGCRAVIWVQDLWPDSLNAVGLRFPDGVKALMKSLSVWIYRGFDGVIGQNEAFLPRLESMGVPAGRLSFVSQWADESESLLDDAVPEGWEPGFTVLFAGNLGRAQGLETILEAAELTRHEPGLQWVLMGDGTLRSWLVEEVGRRGLSDRVILPGRRPAEEMSAHYRRADLLLVSLRPDPILSATVPGKVQPCLAAGRPILGALDGVAAEVIRASGAGEVVVPGDAMALAAAALRLARMPPDARALMGARGRSWYEAHYSFGACAARLEQQLRS